MRPTRREKQSGVGGGEEEKKQKASRGQKGKMEGSGEEKATPWGSPAGTNNGRQNAVGHPLPRFLKPREIDRPKQGGRRERSQWDGQDFSLSAQR